jgi:Reverse transcriptase (RNA-dependent DNA polymerase)
LKLIENLCGQKQAGRVWNQHLHKNLLDLGWKQSKAADCMYYKNQVMFVIYVDDGILASPDDNQLAEELKILQGNFKVSVEGTLID